MKKNTESLYDFVQNHTEKCRLLVIGDVMLDKYYYGEVNRISPEAPVPVTHVLSQKETLGGAANVAHNLALLGCKTSIAGYVGEDYHCQSLLDKLISCGIDYKGLVHTEAPTTTKLRVIGGHQQMMRLDFEETSPVEMPYSARLLNYVEQRLSEGLDCIIISDYGKGACTYETCRQIIEFCHTYKVPVIVDPKGNDWSKYTGVDYITPNIKEMNEVLPERIKNKDEAVEKAAHYLMRKYKIKNVVATRSEAGLSLVCTNEVEHIPTKAQEVFDVSGAGDTVIAVMALALAGGIHPKDGAYMANLAASVVVAKLGTYAISKEELINVMNE